MTRRGSTDPAASLESREAEVLKTLIREHILTGEPIGSRTVSRCKALELSPATIRSIMADLESRGLLAQPHTSAGRVPTDKGYRLYVDHLMRRPPMVASEAQAIDQAMSKKGAGLNDLLSEASRQLSYFSNQVGLVLAPELQRIVVDQLEFVRLDGRRVVAVMIGRTGVVHNRMLEVDEAPEQDELDRISRYLSEEFGGRTLPEMRELLILRMSEERAAYDRLIRRGLSLGRQAVESGEQGADVFVEGASNLLDSPEFADIQVARGLFKTLEQKRELIDLLSRVLGGRGVQVVIGEETSSSDLARCSLVASTYGVGDRVVGTVGIVGPTRMAYARAISLVDHLAGVLSRILSSRGN